ncbi:aldo/keto reductase [Massilia sp.]|uniref:aldo/keto reductase n=1 Tax=Massilia sp. TaxID=1882437 RepID=UPI0028ACE68A|nr:aldo/keto reductase [Massilia sp.]
MSLPSFERRCLLQAMLAAGGCALAPPLLAQQPPPQSPLQQTLLTRPIPSSGEQLPVVGLGSWITFNVGNDAQARAACTEVVKAFFAAGGRLIDSSPMYGSAQSVIGDALARLGHPKPLFAADKVWTSSGGPAQIDTSRKLWRIPRFDLLQVHNLLAWEDHLPLLLRMKATNRLRYVGITTSEGRRHGEIVKLMESQPLDFVQVSYNVLDREVENRILPLARERRIAVIVNRPFRQGDLTQSLAGKPLPGWAAEIGCTSWAQILLKFIVSHPDVTCAIPATSNPRHATENMLAARGPLPDQNLRRRIVADVQKLT